MPVFDFEIAIYKFFSQRSKWLPLESLMEALSDFGLALYLTPLLAVLLIRKFGAKTATMPLKS